MQNGLRSKEKGFTIIEVVLVLAIAGLIFLIVFLALPQLQRSRRDTQRRQDAGKVVASLESYASNNNGTYPTSGTAGTFIGQYITGKLTNPNGTGYTASWNAGVTPAPTDTLFFFAGTGSTDCAGAATGARSAVVRVALEEGVYCQDNQ